MIMSQGMKYINLELLRLHFRNSQNEGTTPTRHNAPHYLENLACRKRLGWAANAPNAWQSHASVLYGMHTNAIGEQKDIFAGGMETVVKYPGYRVI